MSERRWLKVEAGHDGKPIAHLPNGKIVLFKRDMLPPVNRIVDTIIVSKDDNKAIGEWTGAMKPTNS
ncbi:MAG: hypothetical protein A2812_03210 [Candidatus Staskawiczbacteria bacterium RIFCSPHIGHO2_01_FULL_36_16]|uniref:Uncharacterized protein n=1 Tax=Candidatus Staskawiczbacteria bacterium RIFCSPHIGHO2_01_FULL_36_16 TaxID=1802200 RepID=A0A1G2HPI4_9BACT|nr:MAG: hypothetical protein A2812_03210 [Candidatus Staskawiczbacteria bacterium RIFCSPHIGHO2_01_FULL_36_16]